MVLETNFLTVYDFKCPEKGGLVLYVDFEIF